ncbi:polymerase delta-interacting 3 [Paramuricea clavata]|uniref:Polymerase delta-interacting 3 n=1 Tax=Paramuricea clavata TaxID=317549 RepID=A0A6S7GD04_PARCT|nr:polymerase delta-interacting 3 [Paramuricea clavata]
MVGRSRKNDVKSRLGKRNLTTAKPKTGRIRDARDVLKQKGSTKGRISKPSNVRSASGRPRQATTQNTKARVRRLMPLKELLGKEKTVKHTASSPKGNIRTLSLTSGSLRVTTKQPELCRKAIVSSRSLKIVTPSNSISKTQDTAESATTPKRTLRNDLYTSRLSSYVVEEDLRTSSPNLSFTSLTEERPSLVSRRPATRPALQNNEQKKLTKIVVTNLHPRVIQADIAELFGAVGSLVSVKLENSVAEVVFVKVADADSAYHKYHNRMLDGQPMKCTLGLANPDVERTQEGTSVNYSGAELVYPPTSSRPVVFQVRI